MAHDAEDKPGFPALQPAARRLLSELTNFLAASGDQYVAHLSEKLEFWRLAAGLKETGPIIVGGGKYV